MAKHPKINPVKLKRYYFSQYVSIAKTAKEFNCSPTTIRNHIKKHGWNTRRQSMLMRGRKLSPERRAEVVKNLRSYKGVKV